MKVDGETHKTDSGGVVDPLQCVHAGFPKVLVEDTYVFTGTSRVLVINWHDF